MCTERNSGGGGGAGAALTRRIGKEARVEPGKVPDGLEL